MHPDDIIIRGAKEHNLKNIDVLLPRFKLVVITGVSGSGKSSLAFDTLYAEGQRRYVESLSAYARQFIGKMRSTVGTVTEVYDYLRVLFARVGTPHCPQCGRQVRAQSAQQMVEQVAALPEGTRFQILAPVARNRKGTFKDAFAAAQAQGFARMRVDGEVRGLDEKIRLDKNKKHDIEIIVDRLVALGSGGAGDGVAGERVAGEDSSRLAAQPLPSLPSGYLARLTDSVETALLVGGGTVVIDQGNGSDLQLSEHNACAECGLSFPELTPAMFSFNSPLGMCPECNGLGTKVEFDRDRFVDPDKSLHDGGVRTWGELRKKKSSGTYRFVRQIAESFAHDLDTPWRDLSPECQQAILYGGVRVHWQSESARATWQGEWDYEGTINATRRRYHQTKSEHTRKWYASFMSQQPCPACRGQRLRPESAAVTLMGSSINELTALSIGDTLAWVSALGPTLSTEQTQIAEEVLKEVQGRLQFLLNVGLHYLSLDRSAPTLSGGEGQRIRLASQIGCGLVGVLYVLDEPSIGLHARDNRRLLQTLEQLRDLGNTVVVVEHDEETIRTADWIIDLGPGAGINGGEVVAAGPLHVITDHPHSLTARYLRGELQVTSPNGQRRPTDGRWLVVRGARQNNLKDLTIRFPLGLFTCVTGVSGSGKSSLVAQTLHPALATVLHNAATKPGTHEGIDGLEHVDKVISITQDPIGRTPRSNPATYVQALTHIRDLFALIPEAKTRGYKPGRFSFNVKGGRCEVCRGHGQKKITMHFLPDVWVTCNVCNGTRFNRETLQIRYKGKNISEVLGLDIEEALRFFGNVPKVRRILQTLVDVGLGYVKLGQSATTLSGGEAQRIKLSKELARASTGDTVYILDEPTTGLHFADIQKLLDVLHRLTDAGNTVIVIEHNMDVIKTADWIVDLGPEGGDAGGHVVTVGSPEDVMQVEESYTGQFLRRVLQRRGVV